MNPRGQIPESFIQEVLARVDIVELVGRHVQLKKGGANFIGLCPFHGEKTPSFTVSPSKQFYHCFGCGAHGDAIRFLMEHQGAGFVDAVKDLAQQVGLKVPERDVDPAEQARADEARARHASITEVLAQAAEHYRARLKDAPRAIDYLRRRGLSGEVARDFGLGYAPEGWHNLASAFAHYDDPLLVDAGLVIVREADDEGAADRRYDRFRDRIMFPIRSVKGEVIGFGGRVLDAGEPKYLNSPETPAFVKGRELYGLYEARTAIRERGHVLVVEGYMDVVALAQSGFGNAVATLGTACTPDHVHKLFRFTDHVVFAFDGDAAGRRAAGRALEAALPHATDVRRIRFLFLPPEHDPDSYVREHGAEAFERFVAEAVPLSRQLVAHAGEGLDLTDAEDRARLLAQARPLWNALPQGALRSQILAALAETARTSADELARLWGIARPPAAAPSDAARASAWRPRPRPTAAVLLPQDQAARRLLLRAHWWLELGGAEHEFLCQLPGWHGALFRWLERDLTEHGPREWPALRDAVGAEPFAVEAMRLVDGADLVVEPEFEDLKRAVDQARRAAAIEEHRRVLGRA
jgi:DNA primase